MAAKIFNMPGKLHVLWIADSAFAVPDPSLIEQLADCRVDLAGCAAEGLGWLETQGADLLLASLPLPDCPAARLLQEAHRIDPALPVIIHDPAATMADAVHLARLGADQVFDGPLDPQSLEQRFRSAVRTAPPPRSLPASHGKNS